MEYTPFSNFTDYKVRNFTDYNPSKIERNYAHLAFRLALTSGVKHGRHCAIILDENDNILSAFVNRYNHIKTSSTHSEVGAINEYLNENPYANLKNCKMMVIRGNFLGKFTMSKPCLNCYHTILESGIKTIIFSSGHLEFKRMILD